MNTPHTGAPPINIWDKGRDFVTILLIPAVVWLNTQTQRNAEMAYELTNAKTQIKENRANVVELRRDYNALNLQFVELKATLRAIQDSLGGLKTQLDGVEGRLREIETSLQRIQGANQYRVSNGGYPNSGNSTLPFTHAYTPQPSPARAPASVITPTPLGIP